MAEFNYPLFIELIQSHQHLYDKSLKEFKDDSMKSNSYRQIANILEVTEHEVIHKWKNLRDRYGREKRKLIPSGSGASRNDWPYLKQMTFLDKYIKPRTTYSSIKPSTSSKKDDCDVFRDNSRTNLNNDFNIELVALTDSSTSSILSPPTIQPQLTSEPPQFIPKGKGKKKNGDEIGLLSVAQDLANDISNELKFERKEKTLSQVFGEYVGKRLEEFSPNRKIELRRKIVELLETPY